MTCLCYFRCDNPQDEQYTNIAIFPPTTKEKVEAYLKSQYKNVLWRTDPLPTYRLHACDGNRVFVPTGW